MRLPFVLAAAVVAASAGAHAAPWGPAAVRQVTTPAIVSFAADSDTLSAEARARLDQVVADMPSYGAPHVTVAGFADKAEGTAEYAVGLSQRRANNARDYLVSRGVPASKITTEAFGQTLPAVEASAAEPRNRRVEITFGPGSGW